MSETNEQRIAIYETEDAVFEGNYGDFYHSISRADAVERMAKAMCIASGADVCEECKKRKDVNCLTRLRRNGHIMRAEAALDALINSQDNDHVDNQKRITDGD